VKVLLIGWFLMVKLAAREPLTQRTGHPDPFTSQPQKALRGGPSQFDGMFI
jgi:hypothetical protein